MGDSAIVFRNDAVPFVEGCVAQPAIVARPIWPIGGVVEGNQRISVGHADFYHCGWLNHKHKGCRIGRGCRGGNYPHTRCGLGRHGRCHRGGRRSWHWGWRKRGYSQWHGRWHWRGFGSLGGTVGAGVGVAGSMVGVAVMSNGSGRGPQLPRAKAVTSNISARVNTARNRRGGGWCCGADSTRIANSPCRGVGTHATHGSLPVVC